MSVSVLDEHCWEVARECDACGDGRYSTLLDRAPLHYVECGGCGAVRLFRRVAPDRLGLVYGDYYRSSEEALTEEELEAQLANPTFAHRHRRLSRFVSAPDPSIFEVGCGDGNFLAFLRRRGWAVGGCEFGAGAVRLIEARHGIEAQLGDVTGLALRPGSLEVVGAYHVFEHVYRPLEWLTAVRRALRPGGILHLQLPNTRCLDRRLLQNCWSAWCFPQHVYFYGPATLEELLRRNGFRPLSLMTYDPWHSPGAVSASFRNKLREVLRGRPPWSEPRAEGEAAPGGQSPAAAPARRPGAVARAVVSAERVAATTFARVESWARLGNVVDVIAEAVP